jgi:thermitase
MRRLTSCILLSFSAFLSLAHAGEKFHPNHLFIKMKPGQKLLQSALIDTSKHLIGNIYLAKSQNIEALAQELSVQEDVEYVQKDYYAEKRNSPKHEELEPLRLPDQRLTTIDIFNKFNDPFLSKLWGFSTKTGMDVVGAYDTLPLRNPREIIVAVVDTGVDHTHEDLKDSMWVNTKEIPNDKIDNDKNGYIDDIHGINTLVRDRHGRATMDTRPSGEGGGDYHGTHVAGTIGATQNNFIGIAGIASNAKIMAIRTVPDQSDELDSNIVEAFIYAAKNGARVINCSFGKNNNEGGMVVRDTINAIEKKGVLVVAAAGNDHMSNNDIHIKYPASFDSQNLLVIAATEMSGDMSNFSNYGPKTVDVAAPGSDIYSTLPGNDYGPLDGTSMAAPNASGVATLILGYFPNLSAVQLKKVIMDSVVKVPEFKNKMVSGGRINLNKALQLAAKKI